MYVGMLSGTSCDGVDLALVDFSDGIQLYETHFLKYPSDLKTGLLHLIESQNIEISQFSQLDARLGQFFSTAVNELIDKAGVKQQNIKAIGSHGQTVFHDPDHRYANSIQIGSAAIIVARTGVPVISQFRQADLAHGGQGAPLAPVFHQLIFADIAKPIVVLNLGGIANISYLAENSFQGFDTGPANCLMDLWIQTHKNESFDRGGQWAKSGNLDKNLLERMLKDDYFSKTAPKSTGREYFNKKWLIKMIGKSQIKAVDVQCTLAHLSVHSIKMGLAQLPEIPQLIIICGGGSHNHYVFSLIEHLCQIKCKPSSSFGYHPDYIEAMLFAWLAYQYDQKNSIDMRSITGSHSSLIYGVKCFSSLQ